ncbi:MAG: undecaprenyldiphospho-muramoylpentapeptide beta-N-acetylglucosaminyltransferase [Synoicihabitans sp.]
MSRFVIACGGTGGHLAPGIALAQWLVEDGHRPLLLISDKQIDARLTEKYPDFEFQVIPGAPLLMGASGFVRFAVQQMRGLLFSWKLIRRERPVGIIGFGGFTTASIIVAGWMRGVPVALHEANRVVGRAVRTLARFADRIYLPRGVRLSNTAREKIRHCGLPVRHEVRRRPRDEAAERFGLDAALPTLVILGGSQGARSLNEWSGTHASFFASKGVQILNVCGPSNGETGQQVFAGPDGREITHVRLPFCDEMALLYSAADLVISRSGAGTLAELVRCQTPAILVPYPFAADNHQAANAADFAHRGGGVVLAERELDRLRDQVDELLFNEARLATLRAQLGEMARSEALQLMLLDFEALAGTRPKSDTYAPWEVATP